MLPVVVIGADDSVCQAFEPWNAGDKIPVLFFDTVEDAGFGLADQQTRREDGKATEDELFHGVSRTDAGAWRCTVVYGPNAFGPIITQAHKLAHTGWTVVATESPEDNQHAVRRFRDQRVEGEPANTMIWEAMARVAANFVIDSAVPAAYLAALEKLLTEQPEP